MNIFDHALAFLNENAAIIGTIAGVIFGIVKAVSNEKAPAFIAMIQRAVDFIAEIVMSLGKMLAFVSNFLGNLIKSDGFLGKK